MNGMGGTNRVSRVLGTGCMVFGSLLIAAAMGLFIRNIRQAKAAEESANAALAAVKAVISEKRSVSGNEWEVNTNNLVIAAHNYPRHFGMLSKLEPGDEVIFVDMEGKEQNYEVAAVEVLSPESVEEITAAGYALTMFTCTYGGSNRVTVRCN